MASQKNKKQWYIFGVILVFLIAFSMRIIGIDWGMPHGNLHPDEGIIYNSAYQCALDHQFEVRDYYRPNHVTIKLNTLLYVGIQELYFEPMGMGDFATNYSENFALFTTVSRVIFALFGVGTVVFAYCIGRFFGKGQALVITLLFAIFPSFIEHSHYITPDMPLLFFLMGVLWAAFCYYKKPAMHWLFWMSLFTAFAVCEKYPGLYGCVIIAVTVCVTFLKKPMAIVKNGFLAILFVLIGIMAISPVLLIDLEKVMEVIAGQNKQYHIGADGFNFGETLWFYAETTGVHLGLILSLLALYGMIKMFQKDTKVAIILMSLFVYIIPISTLSIHWERYALPLYAVGLVFGANGAFYLVEALQSFLKKREEKGKMWKQKKAIWLCMYTIVFLLPLGSMVVGGVATTISFLAPDTRIFLQDDMAAMNISAANTAYDCNTPLDPGGFYGVFSNYEAGDPHQFKYGNAPRYVMTSSAQRDLYIASDQEEYGWIKNFYETLDEDFTLIYCYPAEVPQSYFIELKNLWYNAKLIYRYIFRGAAVGYEIRIYERP